MITDYGRGHFAFRDRHASESFGEAASMKRRAICFITALALCLGLCPIQALAADGIKKVYSLTENMTDTETYSVTTSMRFDAKGYSYTVSADPAVLVKSAGRLYLTYGRIESTEGAGIKVETEGFLCVDQEGMTVAGTTYGLDIASGGEAQLSGGTFTGEVAAIRAEDYRVLLASTDDIHYAYFDNDGNRISLFDADGSQMPSTTMPGEKAVTVKACKDHDYTYRANGNEPTHNGTCIYCGAKTGPLPCTFRFNNSNHATCKDSCGHTLDITVSPAEEVYNGTDKPSDNVLVTVKLDGALLDNSHYTVDRPTRVDVGDTLITVTGVTYNGTYTKTFSVTQATPVITWARTESVAVDYDGSPVDASDLPGVIITDIVPSDEEGLRSQLYFSYKKTGDADFTDDLPTDAGTYQIIASLPETHNYYAASSAPLTLEIKKINPIKEAPKANNLTYNRSAQELVTPGTLDPRAVGAVILFARSADGPWSTDIPKETNAGSYEVWYKVEGIDNYNGVGPTEIEDVEIQRKPITPEVRLSYYTCVYDGGFKQPSVTVADPTDGFVLPDSEYKVTYNNNQNVGKADVKVTDKENGNYQITETTVQFEITAADQFGLTITNIPNTVTYGDVFTLGTAGGSGNGTVTWKITAMKDGEGNAVAEVNFSQIATINSASGQVTVTGVGTVTVRATKSGTDNDGNHKDATAEWTFTAAPKRVTAIVTADSKTYDGNTTATVHIAVPEQDIVPGDTITITELTGTFSDANAGTGKTVNVTGTAVITVNGTTIYNGAVYEKYIVTIPTTATADIHKAAATAAAPTPANVIYDRSAHPLVTAGSVSGVSGGTVPPSMEYSLYADGPWSENIPQATDAGSYDVWYRVKESDNYLGTDAEKVVVTIVPKTVSNPIITLDQSSYEYDGSEKKPAVTVKDGDDVIPASEYTVTYSNNVNAGTATVIVSDNSGGNYTVNGSTNFAITEGQAVLTGTPQAKNLTYNGQPQDLVTVGTADGGSLEYFWKEGNAAPGANDTYSPAIPQGTEAGLYKVYYRVKGDGNHTGIDTLSVVYVTIQPKTVSSPVITLALPGVGFVYDGSEKKPAVTVMDDGREIPVSEYTVAYSDNVDAGTATVRIIDSNGGNYTVNGSKTFTIAKAKASFTTAPVAENLTYTGKAQPLVIPGAAEGGTAVYSLNNGAYSAKIPTGIASGTYEVRAKVLGDRNHEDSAEVGPITVTIGKKTVTNPDIELSSTRFRYNGSEQKPTVTVKDEQGNMIPANEYIVTYEGSTVNVGDYTVRIASRGNNYNFTFTDTTKSTFKVTIAPEDQETLTITGKPSVVHYGDAIQLSTTGGSGNGTVTWSIVSGQELITAGGSDGRFIITGVGDITIKAVRTPADGSGYAEAEDTWTFYAYPKPVTAVVTAANKTYDGNRNADLTVTVPGTNLTIAVTDSFKGTFDSANVGTDKTVAVSGISAHVTVTGDANLYSIAYPETATASITPVAPTVSGVAENAALGPYTGEPQALVTAGTVNGVNNESGATVGYLVYSLDGNSYGLSVPTGTGAGTYTVWYKVMAGGNYRDSAPVLMTVTIDPKTVDATNLEVTCSPETFPYDGTQKTPYITVKDTSGNEIPASEYTVTFEEASRTATGTYKFTVTAKPGGNYTFTGSEVTGTFTVVEADQAPLSIVVSSSLTVFYGDTFRLSTVGGSGTGAVTWKIESGDTGVATIDSETGVVTVTGTGAFTVTAYKEGTPGSYNVSNTDSVTFTAKPKQITPVITVKDKDYDGTTNATLNVTWNWVGSDNFAVTVTGAFVTADVGTNKQVIITVTSSDVLENYEIVLPALVTGSIYKVDAKLAPGKVPQANPGLVYTGGTQSLLAPEGETVGGIGMVEYSLSEKGSYSTVIPTGTNAGTYTVWYRVAESVNWTGIGPVSVEVTITPKAVNHPTVTCTLADGEPVITVTGDDGMEIPAGEYEYSVAKNEDGTSYTVTVTAKPDGNYSFSPVTKTFTFNESEAPVDSGNTGSGSAPSGGASTPPTAQPGTESASIQTSVRNGTASTVINDAAGNELADRAVTDQSKNVIIKPEITGEVTRTEVSIPSSAIGRLGSETDASLTVSTPVADVTIPNKALEVLSAAGDTVSVVTERVENTIVLTLSADGQELTDISGGLTLTVPVEDAGPGTVAVLVYADGTRETVRRSVAGKDSLRVPLNGSATVEIVSDNSKEFTDVPADSWAADAVAFASAHELFKGTGKKTFSPETTMSRAMLVTVLYNLEGCPEQSLTDQFSDVDSGAWYAAAVSWAAANGITNGYGDGRFGPDDDLTREQLAVMLWRYVGKTAADKQVLRFTDADQASGYALEALYWATENKVLNGCGNSILNPGGMATRAQAAQMLKNFIESTYL